MIHACHNKQGRKSHHNVGTCLRHVSTQAPMYQRIGNAQEEPSLWYGEIKVNKLRICYYQVVRVLKMKSDLMKSRILYRCLETNHYLCTIIQNKMGINKLKVVLTEEAQAFLDAQPF